MTTYKTITPKTLIPSFVRNKLHALSVLNLANMMLDLAFNNITKTEEITKSTTPDYNTDNVYSIYQASKILGVRISPKEHEKVTYSVVDEDNGYTIRHGIKLSREPKDNETFYVTYNINRYSSDKFDNINSTVSLNTQVIYFIQEFFCKLFEQYSSQDDNLTEEIIKTSINRRFKNNG